jgi:hypothetical protein
MCEGLKHQPIEIDGDGFITKDVEDRFRRLLGTKQSFANAVIETVQLANEILNSLEATYPHETKLEQQKVATLALLAREIEVSESMVILAAYGVRQELYSLIRIFLDAYFILANVCSDQDFFREYCLTDEITRLKLMNVASTQNHELFEKLKNYADDDVRNALRGRIEEDGIRPFRSEEYAKKVGCSAIYDSRYRLASSAIHTSPRCLQEYIETNDDGYVCRIVRNGDAAGRDLVLADMASFLLVLLQGVCEVFAHPEPSAIKRLKDQLETAI